MIICIHLAILAGICFQASFAQYENLKFQQYDERDGLSINNVNCFIQDPEGFIWIGTDNGLNLFDGYTFKQYMNIQGDSLSLIHDHILCFYIADNSSIYIGTQAGICMYNQHTDRFKQYHTGQQNSHVRGIFEEEGEIYMVNDLGRVYHILDDHAELVKNYELYASSFLHDKEGNLWFGMARGMQFINPKTDERVYYSLEEAGANPNTDAIISALLEDGNRIYLGTRTEGIFYLDKSQAEIKPFEKKLGFIKTIQKDENDNLLIGDNDGLKIYNKTRKTMLEYKPLVNQSEQNIAANAVDAIYCDRQRNLWLGVKFRGLNLAFIDKGFRHIEYQSEDPFDKTKKTITAIQADNDKDIWIGSYTNGLEKINLRTKTSSYLPCDSKYTGLQCGTIYELFRDKDSALWIGSYHGSLQRMNPKTNRVETIYPGAKTGNPLKGNDIRSIVEDQRGNYWLLAHGTGVYKWNPVTDSLQLFYNNLNDLPSLINEWGFHLNCDSRGNIWLGTPYGLFMTEDGETFKQYLHDPADPNTLISNEVFTVFEDSRQQIWLGTREGLCKFNAEQDNFSHLTKQDGLANDYVCSILEDAHQNLWISTKKGLSKYNIITGEFESFNEDDGLQNNEFMRNAAAKTPSGYMIFGSVNRGIWFHPDSLSINNEKPTVYLTDFKLFNKSVPIEPGNKDALLQASIRFTKEIVLTHKQKVISFSFVSLNYIHPEKNKYAYMLEGFDDDWIYPEDNREVTYTNLTPGTYVFRVKASNNDGLWNEKGVSLKISILPPYWMTWWFRMLLIIIALGIFLIIYFIRVNSIRRANLNLEKTVDERTQELQSKNEILAKKTEELDESNKLLEERQRQIIHQSKELKEKNKQMNINSDELRKQKEKLEEINLQLRELNAVKDKFFSIIGHDLRNPVNVIKGFVELLEEGHEELNDERKLFYLSHISRTIDKASKLLDNLLHWARSQSGTLKIQADNLNMHLLVKNALSFFKVEAENKNIKFDTKLDDQHLFVYADINMVETIIRNLISNAIKFSPTNSRINIGCSLEKNKKQLLIWVQDMGMGIPPENIDKLFQSETNISTLGTDGETGTGLGLILCKEFVEKNDGKIWVESEASKGSTFYFTLPIS